MKENLQDSISIEELSEAMHEVEQYAEERLKMGKEVALKRFETRVTMRYADPAKIYDIVTICAGYHYHLFQRFSSPFMDMPYALSALSLFVAAVVEVTNGDVNDFTALMAGTGLFWFYATVKKAYIRSLEYKVFAAYCSEVSLFCGVRR